MFPKYLLATCKHVKKESKDANKLPVKQKKCHFIERKM